MTYVSRKSSNCCTMCSPISSTTFGMSPAGARARRGTVPLAPTTSSSGILFASLWATLSEGSPREDPLRRRAVGVSEPFGALEGKLSDAIMASTIEDIFATGMRRQEWILGVIDCSTVVDQAKRRGVVGHEIAGFLDASKWRRVEEGRAFSIKSTSSMAIRVSLSLSPKPSGLHC
jgi:hypothetical protein